MISFIQKWRYFIGYVYKNEYEKPRLPTVNYRCGGLMNTFEKIDFLSAQEKSSEIGTFQAGGGEKVGFPPPLYSKIGWLNDVEP